VVGGDLSSGARAVFALLVSAAAGGSVLAGADEADGADTGDDWVDGAGSDSAGGVDVCWRAFFFEVVAPRVLFVGVAASAGAEALTKTIAARAARIDGRRDGFIDERAKS
jgi:hypothetical protein